MGAYNVLDRALLQNGQSEDISKVLENFDSIATVLNGGIDDTNFGAGLIFDPNKIKQGGAITGNGLVWDGAKWAPGDISPHPPTVLVSSITPTAAASATANVATFIPISNLVVKTGITRLQFTVVSGGGTGNHDIGIYFSDDDITFSQLIVRGSTATPANGVATYAFSLTNLTPVANRRWYFAFVCTSTTPTFAAYTLATAPGCFSKIAGFPLTASVTGVTTGAGNPPIVYGLV